MEAVVGKDLVSELYARELDADLHIMDTEVIGVYFDWGKPTPTETGRYLFCGTGSGTTETMSSRCSPASLSLTTATNGPTRACAGPASRCWRLTAHENPMQALTRFGLPDGFSQAQLEAILAKRYDFVSR